MKFVQYKKVKLVQTMSDIEEKEKTWTEREIMSQGTINSLEENKKVLELRLQKYMDAVSKLA